MSWPEYKGKTVGFAKVMGQLPVSDGSVAYEIMNFHGTETGFLENKFKIMPLIPSVWNSKGKEQVPSQPEEFESVIAMKYMLWDGEDPELLFLTESGVFKFSPSNRLGKTSYGSSFYGDESSNGVLEQFYYTNNNTKKSVKPQSKRMFPPQMEAIGNRIYFTFCDGGGAYVWDGTRIKEFGFGERPSKPAVLGPRSNIGTSDHGTKWSNGGGFSDAGRIGTLNYNLTNIEGDIAVTVGGIEAGLYYYSVVYENEEGAYSASSNKSDRVTIQFHVTSASSSSTKHGIQSLRRRFLLNDIPKGPEGTVARILLRTMNLSSLPPGEVGNLRFAHRIPNNISTQYIDDIPDSELGNEWMSRRSVPTGFYFMKFFNGSMFLMRTEQHPSRIWWSEQGDGGSIAESFHRGHWRDVFPETGPITGSLPISIAGNQSMLVFKEKATHVVGGVYAEPGTEGWKFGTISNIAGCAGPNLSQSSPNGQVIWYGNGTFWMLDTSKEGGVLDVGATIRKKLSTINDGYSRYGCSWVDKSTKEMVFCLPTGDNKEPNIQFIWDYVHKGWRLREDLKIKCVEQTNELTLVSGSWKGFSKGTSTKAPYPVGRDSSSASPQETVWVYGRGYPGFEPGSDLTCTYTSGWMSFSEFGPSFHLSQRAADSVFTLQERSARIATVKTFADWNFDDAVSADLEVSLVHPENDNIAVYSSKPSGSTSLIEPDFYAKPLVTNAIEAKYSDENSRYRERRTYTHRLPIDVPSCTVFSLSLNASCIDDPMAIISIDAFGPISSAAASRTPALYEK